jgi:hypothetical protein
MLVEQTVAASIMGTLDEVDSVRVDAGSLASTDL